MHRRRAAGLVEIIIVLGMVALLARVAWGRFPADPPEPRGDRVDVGRLALDLKRTQILARRTDAAQRLTFDTTDDGRVVGYRTQIVTPDEGEETVRSFDDGLTVQSTRRRVIFRPDGTATGDCEIDVSDGQTQWQVRVDAEAGAILLREVGSVGAD